MGDDALAGIKIVELGETVSSAYCARLLADWGAKTIKIEKPRMGDPARAAGPFLNDTPNPETSGLFLLLNANKQGITLDVATPTGRSILLHLLKDADVFVESNPPQQMTDWRLTFDLLREINPRLIMVSITPFGQTGPYRDYKLYHLNLHHAGGEGYLLPGGLDWERYAYLPPVQTGGQVAFYDAGVAAATAIGMALLEREFSGEGQHIDISQLEVEVSVNRAEISHWVNQGMLENRSTRGFAGGGGLFQCKDGYVLILGLHFIKWNALMKLIDAPEHLARLELNEPNQRNAHTDEINEAISHWARNLSKEEVYHRGQQGGMVVGPMSDARDILGREQYKVRQFFVELEHPVAGVLPYPFVPYRYTESPARLRQPAPLLGQHTEEILVQELGYSREELAILRRTGVI